MAAKLVVLQFPGSIETRYWVEERYQEALEGRLLGIAAICMYSHNDYALSIRGEIRKAPNVTRGLVPELEYQLRKIIHGK